MPKLILSTSNIMGSGAPPVRRTAQTSNIELVASLRSNIAAARKLAHKEGEVDDWRRWTASGGGAVYIPSHDFDRTGLAEEREAYEVTVKLFLLPTARPTASRCEQAREAIKTVLDELHISTIDLLIVSYPGIAFDAEDDDHEHEDEAEAEAPPPPPQSKGDGPHLESGTPEEDVESMLETWGCLEEHHDAGRIKKLGVSEFGAARLAAFLRRTRVRPGVDQINVRDCCVVPRELIELGRRERVELLTHNDCTDILPRGTLRQMLSGGPEGFGVLSGGGGAAGGADGAGGIHGDVEPQWVVKYTAVVKDRGVIENKGYFAMAEVCES